MASIRASKYRHVFANEPKADTVFTMFRIANSFSDSNGIKCSATHFVLPLDGGGGPVVAVSLNQAIGDRRFNSEKSTVMYTHSGAVLDVDFSPFRDNIFATSGEDCMVRCWRIPDEGADKEPALVELTGHSKKVGCIRFSPTVAQVIASAGADQLVKIWDISCGKDLCSVDSAQQQVVDIAWDHTGGIAAFASKDKHIRLCDPRACQVVQTYELAHEGSKSMKLTYMGESDYLLSTGFSKMSMRQYKLWDTRHTKTEVAKVDIDSASGVLMPFFDADTSLLYLAGKGDGNIRFLELSGGVIYPLGEYKSSNSQKGVGMVCKRGLNITGCETARFMKISNNGVEPISFVVPRKSDAFQDDIFPDTAGTVPAMTVAQWQGGEDRLPKPLSLHPDNAENRIDSSHLFGVVESAPPVKRDAASPSPPPMPSAHQTNDELQAAYARIAELEAQMASLSVTAATDPVAEDPVAEVAVADSAELEATVDRLSREVERLNEDLAEATAKLHTAVQERDAALARIAELEGTETSPMEETSGYSIATDAMEPL